MKPRVLFAALFALLAMAATTPKSEAASAPEIDAGVHATLDNFFYRIRGARELAHKSVGILVFPSVVKAGFGFGGEYGEGALLIHGRPADYSAARSIPTRSRVPLSVSSSTPED